MVRGISVVFFKEWAFFSLNDWNVWAECYIAAFDIIARIG